MKSVKFLALAAVAMLAGEVYAAQCLRPINLKGGLVRKTSDIGVQCKNYNGVWVWKSSGGCHWYTTGSQCLNSCRDGGGDYNKVAQDPGVPKSVLNYMLRNSGCK